LAEVLVGAVQRWRKVVTQRAVRHARRGTTAQLHLANVATYLVDRRNWMKRHGFTAKSFGRLVDSAIKFFKKIAEVAKATICGAANAPANKVNERINRQAGYWRCSIDQVNMFISVLGGALPLVGGVQRGGRVFEGAPPDDAPEDVIDLVGGAADNNGDDIDAVENDEDEESLGGRADTSAAGAGGVGGGSAASGSAVAGGSSGGGGGSGGRDDSGRSGASPGSQLAGGASGRSVRAAQAENALIPGASELFVAMTQTFKDSGRRHEAEQNTARIAALSSLLARQPDLPGVADELRELLKK